MRQSPQKSSSMARQNQRIKQSRNCKQCENRRQMDESTRKL